jgi:hypothetical protein
MTVSIYIKTLRRYIGNELPIPQSSLTRTTAFRLPDMPAQSAIQLTGGSLEPSEKPFDAGLFI